VNEFKELIDVKISPTTLKVRTYSDISLKFKLDFHLPQNSILTIRLRGGRNNKNDWYFMQPYDKASLGYAHLEIEGDPLIIPILTTGKELSINYFISDKEGIRKYSIWKFNLYNTLVQSLAEEHKKIDIFIRLPDKRKIFFRNCPHIKIINDKINNFSIFCPSIVEVGENFKLLIRTEDKFKNLVKDFEGKLEFYKIKQNNGNLNPKKIGDLEIKAENRGILQINNLRLLKEGLYYFCIKHNGKEIYSNPILCKPAPLKKRLYWGFIHGHTSKSDGLIEPEEYFKNLIKAGLDFGTTTEHSHLWETKDEDFEEIKQIVNKYNNDGNFISIFGYEYGTWYTGYGDICIYHFDDQIPIFRSELNKYNSPNKLIKNLLPYSGKVLMISHHTALRPGFRNWEQFNNDLERLVEIYSTWGNQEYPSSEGNPLPPRYKFFGYGKYTKKRGPILEKKGCFVKDALAKGYKLGFTAGGDDHFGIYPSGELDPDNGIYPPGIMAVWSENLTKEAIWKALMNRKCYGTTGPRIIIEFFLNDYFMGDIINIEDNSGLIEKRILFIKLFSPIIIKKIQLIRNNKIFSEIDVNTKNFEDQFIDSCDIESLYLNHSIENESFIFYYVRIFLAENNMAWSSPIWIIKDK